MGYQDYKKIKRVLENIEGLCVGYPKDAIISIPLDILGEMAISIFYHFISEEFEEDYDTPFIMPLGSCVSYEGVDYNISLTLAYLDRKFIIRVDSEEPLDEALYN